MRWFTNIEKCNLNTRTGLWVLTLCLAKTLGVFGKDC
jgi:hypothetical protein